MAVQVRVARFHIDGHITGDEGASDASEGRDADGWVDVADARHLATAVGHLGRCLVDRTRHVVAQVAHRPDGCPTSPDAAAAVAEELDWLTGEDPDVTVDEARDGTGRLLAVRSPLAGPDVVARCRTGSVGWRGYGEDLAVSRRERRDWGSGFPRDVLTATHLTQEVVTGLDGTPVAVIRARDTGAAVVSDLAFGGPSCAPGALVVAADPDGFASHVTSARVTVPWSTHFAALTAVLTQVMRDAAGSGGRVWWRDPDAPATFVDPGRYS